MPGENGPDKRNQAPRKLSRRDTLLAGALILSTGAASYGASWRRTGAEIEQEKLQATTETYEGTHEVTEIVSIENVLPVEGYTIEHRGIVVSRELDTDVGGFNLFGENKIKAEVDVDTYSTLSINPEKLSKVDAVHDEEAGTITVEMSQGDLTVESFEVRNSRNTHLENEGLVAKAGGAWDGISNENKVLEEAQNDIETLAVNLALQYADRHADSIVEETWPELRRLIEDAVITELGLQDADVSIKVTLADDGKRPEVKGFEEHNKAIEELGGQVHSEGDVTILASTNDEETL